MGNSTILDKSWLRLGGDAIYISNFSFLIYYQILMISLSITSSNSITGSWEFLLANLNYISQITPTVRAVYEGGFEAQFGDCLTERINSLDKDIEIMCSYHYQVL